MAGFNEVPIWVSLLPNPPVLPWESTGYYFKGVPYIGGVLVWESVLPSLPPFNGGAPGALVLFFQFYHINYSGYCLLWVSPPLPVR